MTNWNEEGAPNNNLSPDTITSSKLINKKTNDFEFSEELSDGGERNENIKKMTKYYGIRR